jgi:hypothetical protein
MLKILHFDKLAPNLLIMLKLRSAVTLNNT